MNRFSIKVLTDVCIGPGNNWLDFGGAPDHDPAICRPGAGFTFAYKFYQRCVLRNDQSITFWG